MPITLTPPPAPEVKTLGDAKAQSTNKRKIICFSDFDGTIFMQDTGHVLFDNHGCGSKRREMLDEQIKTGERSFRDVSEEMWGSLNVPFEDGFEVMEKTLEIDPDFQSFHQYCLKNDIPFNVISAGLKPILRKVLDTFLGEEASSHIGIVANDAHISADGSEWKPIWRHDTELGHDKAQSITEARKEAETACDDGTVPLIVFIGDGVSDLPAAREADVLFARRGLRLEEYCKEHNIPYIPFDTFADIQREIERIRLEDEQKTGGKGLPVRFNPRANLWRRVSSKNAVPRYVLMSPTKEEKMFLWPEAFSELKKPEVEVTQTSTPTIQEHQEHPIQLPTQPPVRSAA
ncbi:HAD-like domain-containing protein [Daldinia sp. FL1419]|nr:HAD-like domain-containing protein [Daldinia sp. FL1419]